MTRSLSVGPGAARAETASAEIASECAGASATRACRRRRDAAVVLPILGTALVMPPLVGLSVGGGAVAGVPAVVLYLFGVWAGLILAIAWLTAGLCRDRRRDGSAPAGDGPARDAPARDAPARDAPARDAADARPGAGP